LEKMSGNLLLVSRSLLPRPPNFPLKPGTFVVGRSSGCDLILPHESVSRRHAEIQVALGCVTVVDLDSRNGTFIEDERIRTADLLVGQKVQFGGIPFLLVCADRDAEPDSDLETADHRGERRTVIPEAVAGRLSPAQNCVLVHLVEGLTERQTSERLCLSPHTVHNHTREIYSILGVHSRAEVLALLLKY
jgi:pSer/pThr/pTyr-binding forkhead associated (FHA) protein